MRAKGVGMAVAVNWISNTIIVSFQSFPCLDTDAVAKWALQGIAVPPMIMGIGYGTYIFFACFCFLASFFSFFFVPDTSNLTLEQIDRLFEDDSAHDEAMLQRQIAQDIRC